MESYIKISLNSKINPEPIILPQNLNQLISEFKNAYNLNKNQLSNLKIYYIKENEGEYKAKEKIKIYLENEAVYKEFLQENNIDLIEAEIDEGKIKVIENIKDLHIKSNFLEKINNNKMIRCFIKNCYLIPSIKIVKDKNNNF